MGYRKKWILPMAVVLVISASMTIYFGNNVNHNKPVIYQPREVKINGIHLADS